MKKILSFFRNLSPFPAYALVVAVIIILVLLPIITKDIGVPVISSEKLTIRDSEIPSSSGFMSTEETKAVNKMHIKYMKGDEVLFAWETIRDAEGYDFLVKDKTAGKIIHSQNLQKIPSITLKKDIFKKNSPYSWLITGKTDEGKYFEYTGQFIIKD